MRRLSAFLDWPLCSILAVTLIGITLLTGASAQATAQSFAQQPTQSTETPAISTPVVPQLVRYAGKLPSRLGDTVEAEFRIYAAAEGGDPIWTETQQVTVAEDGSYSVLLGGVSLSGLPQTVFAGGAARWLGVSVDRSPELERVLLSSVPYAMKSADAESLAGHAASDFVTQEQLAQLAQLTQAGAQAGQTGNAAASTPALTPGAVTGSGVSGTVPLWTGALTQGDSDIYQVGSAIGINETAPTATLDVNGSENLRGLLSFPPLATATSTTGQRSQLIQLSASAWSSTDHAAVTPTFKLLTNFVNNNTPTATGQLELHFQQGTASLNVLSIASNGVIKFAPSQTFPGTIGSVTAASPLTATTTSGSVALGLNTSALVKAITPSLESAFNSQYAQLDASNVFTGFLQANDNGGPGTSAVIGIGVRGSTGVSGQSDSGNGVMGYSEGPQGGFAGVLGFGSTNPSTTYGTEAGFQSAGVWGDSMAASRSQFAAGVIGTADDADGGSFFNNSASYAALYAKNLGTGPGVSGNASISSIGVQGSGGTGVDGVSPTIKSVVEEGILDYLSGSGVHGVIVSPSALGGSLIVSAAGVWADSSNVDASALLATADTGSAGLFENNTPGILTVGIYNNGTGVALNAGGLGGTCTISSNGDLSCTGTVGNVVPADEGARQVETYSVQSAENWYEDAGTGQIAQGAGHVDLEPVFSTTVNTSMEYHVFLTPKGDCKGLYVTNETPDGFDVHELGGGTSSIAFDYRIMAKRAGYEDLRLKDVTDAVRSQAEQRARTRPQGAGAPPFQPTERMEQLPGGPVRRMPQMRSPAPTMKPVSKPAAAMPKVPK